MKKKEPKEMTLLKSQVARALADYDNLRKRVEVEKGLWVSFAKQELLIKFLPTLDTLEKAQKHLKDEGLKIAINQFKETLRDEGIIEVETEAFNEKVHEAVDVVAGGKKGKIAEVLQKGYQFIDGDIIRPAKVRVHN